MFTTEQIVVMGRPKVKQKVHMESCSQRLVRLAPFGYHHSVGKFLVQESAEILPQSNGSRSVRIIFDQGGSHVHPEAITSHGKPETHDVLHRLTSCHWSRSIGSLLPGMGGIGMGKSKI